jgi:hypothetical protein
MVNKQESRKIISTRCEEIADYVLCQEHSKNDASKYFKISPAGVDSALCKAGFEERASPSFRARYHGDWSAKVMSEPKESLDEAIKKAQLAYWIELSKKVDIIGPGETLYSALQMNFKEIDRTNSSVEEYKKKIEELNDKELQYKKEIETLRSRISSLEADSLRLRDLNTNIIARMAQRSTVQYGENHL